MTPEIPVSITPHLPNGLSTVEQDIARACEHARRDRSSVTLIAVSKTFGAAAIAPVIAAGQRVFGENRVQEAKAKWPALREHDPAIELHLVDLRHPTKPRKQFPLSMPFTPSVRPRRARHLPRKSANK